MARLPAALDPAAAAAAGPELARVAATRVPAAFAAAGALRAASRELADAIAAERVADAADSVTHSAWRAAHDRLRQLVGAAVQRLGNRTPGPELGEALAAWSDPYAADAAGEGVLDALRAVCASAPSSLHGDWIRDLTLAVERAREAGRVYDAAERRRAGAIRQRVETCKAWRDAAEALFEVAPPDDPDRLVALSAGAASDPADCWFDDPDAP